MGILNIGVVILSESQIRDPINYKKTSEKIFEKADFYNARKGALCPVCWWHQNLIKLSTYPHITYFASCTYEGE